MGRSFVVEGAKVKCSKGTSLSKLKLPKGHSYKINGKKVLNVGDHIANVNIMPFGLCNATIPQRICSLSIANMWVNGKRDVLIGDTPQHALASDSFCSCSLGGIIEIVKDGQKKTSVVNNASLAGLSKNNAVAMNQGVSGEQGALIKTIASLTTTPILSAPPNTVKEQKDSKNSNMENEQNSKRIYSILDGFKTAKEAAIAHQSMIPENIGKDKLISLIYVDPNSELKYKFSELYDYKEALKMGGYNKCYIVGYSYYGKKNPKNIKGIDTNRKIIYYTNKYGDISFYNKLPKKDRFDYLTEDEILFINVIYGEAAASSEVSWKAIANVIMNRVGTREWKNHTTYIDVIKNSGFDAYNNKNIPYKEAENYFKNRDYTKLKIEQMIKVVIPICRGEENDITGGCVLYYSPQAQTALHNKYPNIYKKTPSWNFSQLNEVKIIGTENDDFKFYKYR